MRRKVYSEKRQLKLTPLEHFLFENYFSHSYIDSFIHLANSELTPCPVIGDKRDRIHRACLQGDCNLIKTDG